MPAEAEKAAWRSRLLAARTALTAAEQATAAHQLTGHLLGRFTGIARIAAYVPVGTEPGSLDLLDALREQGTVVLLPVVRPKFGLDWGVFRGRDGLTASRLGLWEPVASEGVRVGPSGERGGLAGDRPGSGGDRPGSGGDRLDSGGDLARSGPLDGIGAILVPALAVDHGGTRLGRGAGYYDRALATVHVSVPVVALLHDGELVPQLPADPWDRPVTAAVTPTNGWTNLPLVAHHRG